MNKASGLFLADPLASNASGTALVQTKTNCDASERWIIAPLNNGFRITNASSGLAIDATSDTPDPGTAIVQATPTGNTTQVWVVH